MDAQWAAGGLQCKVLLLPVLIPAALLIPFMRTHDLGLWLGVAWALGWLGFIAWRGVRMMVAGARRGDRTYDRVGKFKLAEAYHSTESATAATRRKRKAVSAR